MDIDWQNNLNELKERGSYLLQSEKWADCQFLVGTTPNQRILGGHKLLLAMASPVFERMFYGNLPDEIEPIIIPDVQPDAFHAMLEYIYTDRVNIASFDKACELCYVAKKYMLPYVVERCTHFLWADLSPKNACRAYEFAKLFDEPRLMQSSMDLIAANTRDVLIDPSFLEVEVSTLMAILDQDKLNIDSEMDLFNCLLKFADERGLFLSNVEEQSVGIEIDGADGDGKTIDGANGALGHLSVEEIKMEPDVSAMMHNQTDGDECDGEECDGDECDGDDNDNVDNYVIRSVANGDEVVVLDSDASGAENDVPNHSARNAESTIFHNLIDGQRIVMNEAMLREAVKKIRFLTLTPQQFAEGPARSKLLHQHEALAILIKISSPTINDCPMPDGFCISRSSRNYYESHRQRDLSSYRHSVPSNGSAASCYSGASVDASHGQSVFGGTSTTGTSGMGTSSAASTGSGPVVGASGNASAGGSGGGGGGGGSRSITPLSINVNAQPSSSNNVFFSSVDPDMTDTRRSYCVRTVNQQFDYRNTSVTDCGLTFQVDTNIWITGVQVPTQVLCGELMNSAGFSERYMEILYAHIQDMHGSRITYTHCTSRVRYDSLLDITFDRPVYIYRNQIYKVYVVFNKVGWYPMYTCVPDVICNRVKFMFNVGNPSESVRDGLIRAIVFSTPQEHLRGLPPSMLD